jgi:hypothetical protein
MLIIPTSIKEIFRTKNSTSISLQVFPASLLGVSAGNCQKSLVDESGMIINLTGTYRRSEMVAVQGLPCAPAP